MAKAMKKKGEFITICLINQAWDGTNYKFRIGGKVAIRLDTITEVSPLVERDVCMNRNEPIWRAVPTKMKIASIMKSTGNGHGINGVSYEYYIDEDSYNRVVEALGITL